MRLHQPPRRETAQPELTVGLAMMATSHSSAEPPQAPGTPHLIDVELALPAGQLAVAGGEFPNEVVAARQDGC